MPCGIMVEVTQKIDFLQVINTTCYATIIYYLGDSFLEVHNSNIYTCYSILYFAILFTSNCKHDFHNVYTC
jgi:hypothetical protein